MDKETRNLLITGFVCAVVGIIMGVGIVAPSVESGQPDTEPFGGIVSEALCEARVNIGIAAYNSCEALRAHGKESFRECSEDVVRITKGFEKANTELETELIVCKAQLTESLAVLERTWDTYEQTDKLFKQCMNLHGAGYEIK